MEHKIKCPTYLSFFERQIAYFNEVFSYSSETGIGEFQSKIKNSRILILGIGGIGSNLAIGLAQAGVGEIILCDFDTVESSNINRTLGYSSKDIGRNKGVVLKDYIRNQYSWCNITTINKRIVSRSDIEHILSATRKVDILINCIDTPLLIKNIISDICVTNDIPFIKGGYHRHYGGIGPFFIPKISGCQRCFDKSLFPKINLSKEMSFSSSNPWLTQMISSLMLSEVIGFISEAYKPQLLHHYLQYDCLTYEMLKFKIGVKEYCSYCDFIPKPYS